MAMTESPPRRREYAPPVVTSVVIAAPSLLMVSCNLNIEDFCAATGSCIPKGTPCPPGGDG